jgi:hypothetical protein
MIVAVVTKSSEVAKGSSHAEERARRCLGGTVVGSLEGQQLDLLGCYFSFGLLNNGNVNEWRRLINVRQDTKASLGFEPDWPLCVFVATKALSP